MTSIRWGILGTAQIARKNWKAIWNSGIGTVTAVASREHARSRQFVQECQAVVPFNSPPKALGSYEELLSAPDVDAVYIPLPTGIRKDWVIRAAEAGKHVICEKPCGNTVTELQEMLDACRRHRVQFSDGVMFMHSQRLQHIREVLDDAHSIGKIRRIDSAFSFYGADEFLSGNIRVHSELEPLGCLGDLGWYCIRFALWTMRWQLPINVTGRFLSQFGRKDSPTSVPTEFSGELLFDGNVSAGFYCSFTTSIQQWVTVSGTNGYLHVSDFVLPFFGNELSFQVQGAVYDIQGCDFNMESHTRRHAISEYSNSHRTAQESNLYRSFATQVQSGALNTDWPEFALKTQQVVNAALESAQDNGRPVQIRAQ